MVYQIGEHAVSQGAHSLVDRQTISNQSPLIQQFVNLLQEYPLRLSYMTNGQNVPDDLLMPSPDFLANLLLGDILP